ncbi:hypothetical protein TNCV_770911 [Trichonephila clavipes]|nr:hypothetical protein TNCV_770911 [Trichonephila clavipes]
MLDVLKLPNQALRVSGESQQTCVAWRCPDGTQRLFCLSIMAVSGNGTSSRTSVTRFSMSLQMTLIFICPLHQSAREKSQVTQPANELRTVSGTSVLRYTVYETNDEDKLNVNHRHKIMKVDHYGDDSMILCTCVMLDG